VPERTPVAEANESPGGSAPAVTAKVYGAKPPVAEIVWLYAVASVPPGDSRVKG
jgi:hypothetical protein